MTGRSTPRRCADWLTLRARNLVFHSRMPQPLPQRASRVAALLDTHGAAPPTSSVEVPPGPEGTIADRRRQLEDGFVELNPDFGVLPEHNDPQQRALAWRREQAMTLGLRVLVELRNENTGPPAARQQAITLRAADGRARALPALDRRRSWDRAEEVAR